MTSHHSKKVLIPAFLFVACTALPALAQTATRHVSYAGLDLSTEVGKALLDNRIASAVRQVCGMNSTALEDRMAQIACRKTAAADAALQMKQVYADYEQRRSAVQVATAR